MFYSYSAWRYDVTVIPVFFRRRGPPPGYTGGATICDPAVGMAPPPWGSVLTQVKTLTRVFEGREVS